MIPMPKPMATIKYGIQFSDKKVWSSYCPQAAATEQVWHPQIQRYFRTSDRKNVEKDSGAADDSGKIDMLQLVQEQSSDKEQESLSCITEHGSEK